MYLVIETCDRMASDLRPAKDIRDAADKANELLKAHCATLDKPEMYDAYAGPAKPDVWPPEMQLADPGDAEMSAWCNMSNLNYDAHIMGVDPVTACDMLDILLKELCKFKMDKPGSDCGDGACEDCPVSRVLEIVADRKAAMENAETAEDQEGNGGHYDKN